MNILFVTEQKILGGGEVNLACVADEMSRRGNTVTIMSPPGAGLLSILSPNVRTLESSVLEKKGWLHCFPFIWRQVEIEHHSFDVIHFYSANCLPMFWRYRIRKVWTIHAKWDCRTYAKSIISHFFCQAVTFVSADVRLRVSGWRKNSDVINLGIERSRHNSLKSISRSITTDESPRPLKLVCIGRFQAIKNQKLLVNAIQKINRPVECRFVGSVNKDCQADLIYFVEFTRLVREFNLSNLYHSRIDILEHSKDVENLYAWSDICVIPSNYESFSMVAAESLTSSRPIVVSDNGAPKSFISGTKCGEIFEAGNSRSLADAVERLANRLHQLQNLDFERFKNEFSVATQCDQYIRLYKEPSH